MNILDDKWVFWIKKKFDRSCVAAKGYHQNVGVDYTETFSLVIKPMMIRVVLSIAVFKGWSICQIYINNAFLNCIFSEAVYVHQPDGFQDEKYPNHFCNLHKFLCSLKQAPCAWFDMFKKHTFSLGFSKLKDRLFTFSIS